MDVELTDLLTGANLVGLYGGFVLVAGTIAFWVLVWPDGRYNRHQLLLVDVGLVLLAVTTVIGPLITVVSTGESPLDVVSREEGASALLRLGVLAATFLFYAELVNGPIVGRRRAAAAAVVVALSLTMVTASGAVTGDLAMVKTVAALGHTLATATWLGGMLALAVVIMPRRRMAELDELVPAYSRLAFVSIVVIVVSGLVHGVVQAGGFGALGTSTYGIVLLIKVAVFVGLLVLGNRGRRQANDLVVRRLRGDGQPVGTVQALAVVTGAELATAAAVLVITAVLVAVTP